MHNPYDKHSTRPGLELSTSEFQAIDGSSEPLDLATLYNFKSDRYFWQK